MALANDVSRTEYGSQVPTMVRPAAQDEVFFKGSIVTMKEGLAYNATNSDNTHVAVGIAYRAVTAAETAGGDGSANGGADIIIQPGTWGDFTPDAASDNPDFTDNLTTVYVKDDNTLSTSSGGSARCSVTLYEVADDDTSLAAQFNVVPS